MSQSPKQLDHFFKQLSRRRFIKGTFRILRYFFLLLIILFVVLWFVLQNEKVQNYLLNKVTSNLTEQLGARVEADRIDIDFFDKLVLDNFYVEDHYGDTLLFSKELKASLDMSIVKILQRQYDIDDIYLSDARLQITRDSGQIKNNLQLLLDKLTNQENSNTTGSSPVFLSIEQLFLNNIYFSQVDEVNGQTLTAFLQSGHIVVDSLDLQKKLVAINSAEIMAPNVVMIDDVKKVTPVDTTVVSTHNDKEKETASQTEKENVPFRLMLGSLDLKEGQFTRRNLRKSAIRTKPDDVIDFDDLEVRDIFIGLDNMLFTKGTFTSSIGNISAKTKSGFELKKLMADKAKISNRRIELSDLLLETPNSRITEKIALQYRSFDDFKSFEDKVFIKADFDHAEIALRDIIVFADKLKENRFFKQNENQSIRIHGKLNGRVNSLKGQNLKIELANGSIIDGDFTSQNLTNPEEAFLDLKLHQLKSDMQTLRLLIPNFNPPRNFDKIGAFDFNGKFSGFFIDFVADGILETEVGNAKLNMRLDLRNGRELAQYGGALSLSDFNLGKWTNNKDFGFVNLDVNLEEGQGLVLDKLKANVGGNIASIQFKKYDYQNIKLDGNLESKLFDGKLSIDDEHIDFNFDGTVDFTDSIPVFDFKAEIDRIALKELNLSKHDLVLSGKPNIKIIDTDLSNIQGDIFLKDFFLIRNQVDSFSIDSLIVHTSLFMDNSREFKLNSDFLNINLNGLFDIQEVPFALMDYASRNYPIFSERLKLKPQTRTIKQSQFAFDFQLKNTKNWTKLIDSRLDTIHHISSNGYFDNISDSIYFDINVPNLKFGNLEFDDILVDLEGKKDFSDVHFEIYHANINGQDFEPIELTGELDGDTLFYEIISTNFTSVLDDLKLNGQFFSLPDDLFQISFFPSNLVILELPWNINAQNYIRFGKNYVETKNFELNSGNKQIAINSINNEGLHLSLKNFNLNQIDEWWNYDRINFDKTINIDISADNIFTQKDIKLSAVADTLEINGDDWGIFDLKANLPDLNSKTDVYLSITKGSEQLILNGDLAPFQKKGRYFENDFNFDVTINEYPLQIAEYFVDNIIKQTEGQFDANVKLDGKFKKPNINGGIRIYDASLRIIYTNTKYEIPDSYTNINSQIFDVSGNYLIDSLGNRALLSGGFLHNHFKDWRLGASISSDKFLFLKTNKELNPIYYGTGIGSGNVSFTGPFNKIDIDINAKTGKGTEVIIPVSYANNSSEVKFIEYIEDKNETKGEKEIKKLTELRGVGVTMNIEMTEEADAMIVFDERAGDIIKGNGNGNIEFNLNRLGEITMYGNYDIVQGNYLFTMLNVVNKPFVVKEGGTIKWTGDPFNALIDIEAEYTGLNTSLSNFISEYLDGVSPGELEQEARKSHNVLLTMYLKGPLKHPDINFDIEFPGLQGLLQSVTQSKLRIVRQDQAELNRQVFGLLVIGGFLPSANSNTFSGRGELISINTISEMLSNQLSIHLTQLLSEVFTDVGFISGVDFNINYNIYDNEFNIDEGLRTTGQALQLRQSLDLFNDRLTVQVGGNIDWGSNLVGAANSAFLAGDVVIEYAVTDDRRFKVRAYQLTDATILGRRNKRGLGISWRREFDTIDEFFGKMKEDAKSTIKKPNGS